MQKERALPSSRVQPRSGSREVPEKAAAGCAGVCARRWGAERWGLALRLTPFFLPLHPADSLLAINQVLSVLSFTFVLIA